MFEGFRSGDPGSSATLIVHLFGPTCKILSSAQKVVMAMLARLFDRTARLPHRWPHRR